MPSKLAELHTGFDLSFAHLAHDNRKKLADWLAFLAACLKRMIFVCSLVLDSAVVLEFLQMLPLDRHGRLMFPKRLLADCAGFSGKSRCGGAGALGHFFRIEQLAAAPKLTGTPVKLNGRWDQSRRGTRLRSRYQRGNMLGSVRSTNRSTLLQAGHSYERIS